MRALSGTEPAEDFFVAEIFVWAAVDSDKASMNNDTAKSQFNLGFDASFTIRFLRDSGGIFAQLREKNKAWRGCRKSVNLSTLYDLIADEPNLDPPSSNSPDHDKRFLAGRDGVGQGRVRRFVR
jgi:hypothetical protein